ncbi:TIGR02652 family protein [Synechococcus sp. H70.2]|uniref:TIGR02652 family protein n=1 Tax=unclassified Synechococcus TaxID=2626047 RepID=UPI0039C305C2
MTVAFSYPIFGPSIQCPHCRQTIAALTLTDTYLCHRHGAFEADPEQEELIHLQSGRRWRLWEGRWYRQHTHADGIRFEIHEELDRLRMQGMRATQVIVAERYRPLLTPYLEQGSQRRPGPPRLYGLPVSFSSQLPEGAGGSPQRWRVINFELVCEPDPAVRQLQSQLQLCD